MSLLLLLLTPGLVTADGAEAIPFKVKAATRLATVRVVRPAQGSDGSGVIIKQERGFVYVLTAAHLVQGSDKVEVHTFSATSYPRAAAAFRDVEVLAQAREPDLAVLRIRSRDSIPGILPLCPKSLVPAERSFSALTSGCTAGKAPTVLVVTVGDKKRIRRPGERATTLAWEVARGSAKGRSGGPLVDRRGYVLGIASGASDGKGYFAHPQEIHRFLERHALDWLGEARKESSSRGK